MRRCSQVRLAKGLALAGFGTPVELRYVSFEGGDKGPTWWLLWALFSYLSEQRGFADMPTEAWLDLISKSHWNNIDLRDGRYNQVIHMTTAAKGAEEFYTTDEHVVRSEGPELACRLDDKVAQVVHFLCCTDHSLSVLH